MAFLGNAAAKELAALVVFAISTYMGPFAQTFMSMHSLAVLIASALIRKGRATHKIPLMEILFGNPMAFAV